MKLVIYDANYNIIDVIENIIAPVVDGNNVKWEGGSIGGITLPFVLLEDSVDATTMSAEKETMDTKENYSKRDLEKENDELRRQLAATNADLMGLTDYVFGGGA